MLLAKMSAAPMITVHGPVIKSIENGLIARQLRAHSGR